MRGRDLNSKPAGASGVRLARPPNPPLQLFVIRHGETEWALTGQHTGVSEIPLTAHGEDEARALAPTFRDLAFTRVLVSPRQRARRTCELAGLGAAAENEPNLAEWGYGEFEGLTPAEIDRRQPGWEVFRDGCPGGETPQQVAGRADRLLQSLSGLRGNVALFTHGHFGRALGSDGSACRSASAAVSGCAPRRSASSPTTRPIPRFRSSRYGTKSLANGRDARGLTDN